MLLLRGVVVEVGGGEGRRDVGDGDAAWVTFFQIGVVGRGRADVDSRSGFGGTGVGVEWAEGVGGGGVVGFGFGVGGWGGEGGCGGIVIVRVVGVER